MQCYITVKNVELSPKNQTFTGFLRILSKLLSNQARFYISIM